MKLIRFTLAMALCVFALPAMPENINPALESPACIEAYKTPSSSIQELASLLDNKLYKSLCKRLDAFRFDYEEMTPGNVAEALEERLWLCYLAASVPVFTYKTSREIEPNLRLNRDTFELSYKSRICLLIEKYIRQIQSFNTVSRRDQNQIITRLLLPYYAHMISQFKNAYEKNPFKITRLPEGQPRDESKVVYIESKEQILELHRKINEIAAGNSFIIARNSSAKDLAKMHAQPFMQTLVSVFPGKYAPVEEFLIRAGFTKEEIPDLIDRTVGRTPATDFLYRGEHRRQHDKLLKNKKKNRK